MSWAGRFSESVGHDPHYGEDETEAESAATPSSSIKSGKQPIDQSLDEYVSIRIHNEYR